LVSRIEFLCQALFPSKGQKVDEAVKTIRIDARPERDSLQCNDAIIGAHADYRREDFVFPRTQSLTMRAREWEDRLKPMRHWAPNFVANIAWEIFA
jgi:hypothetical protein